MDDRLRALERAARAEPADRGAAWAFVHALDQANDERGAWQERCRLARAGDEHAWLELDGPANSGVREIGRVVTRTLDASVRLVGASSRAILIKGRGGLSGLDPDTLATVWWTPGQHDWVAAGSRVFGAGADLLVISAATGEELHRSALPDSACDGAWRWVREQTADRLLLACRGEGPLLVVDTGENLGAVIAQHPGAHPGLSIRAAHGLGLRGRDWNRAVEVFDLETSSLRWGGPGALLDVDTRSALLRGHLPGGGVRLLDVTTGAVSFESLTEARMGYLTRDLVVLLNDVLHFALERTTGAVRWTIPRPPDPIWLECTHDVLYVMQTGTGYRGEPGQPMVLRAVEPADGATRWEHPFAVDSRSGALAVTDGAVVALAGRQLVRISAR